MEKDQLLAEIDDILRTTPSREDFDRQGRPWVGRALAAVSRWNTVYSVAADSAAQMLQHTTFFSKGMNSLQVLLFRARADLRMEVGQFSVVIQTGDVFDYFDEVRKLIATARNDLFFVDPYLDSEFASRFLRYANAGVTIRLLTGPKRVAALLPAVDMFAKQSGLTAQVRSASDIHDRYLFVDRAACYLSGASFKDGAKNAPAVLTQIGDAFQAMWDTYDRLWGGATVERP